MPTYDYRGKAGLVTGAGSGLGRAMAEAFAAAGAAVLVTDIDGAGAEQTVANILRAGGKAECQRVDVARAADVASMVESTVSRFGSLDFAINNAGIEIESTPLSECPDEVFDRIMAVNVRGVFLCLKHELRQMLKQGQGAIVNLCSINSYRPQPHHSVYTASKHAVLGFTRNAAIEAAAGGVRINAIAPGAIVTPMLERSLKQLPVPVEQIMPMLSLVGRLGQPDEVAKAALWLCSEHASFTHGHVLAVDGGFLAR